MLIKLEEGLTFQGQTQPKKRMKKSNQNLHQQQQPSIKKTNITWNAFDVFCTLIYLFFDGHGVSMRLTRVFECFGLFCFVALRCRLCGCSDQICYSHCSHRGYLRSHRVCHVNPLSTHSFPSFYLSTIYLSTPYLTPHFYFLFLFLKTELSSMCVLLSIEVSRTL